MSILACAAVALALQEPQNDLNTASLYARQGQDAAKPKEDNAQQGAGESAAPTSGLGELDAKLEDFAREFESGWNVNVLGYLKFGVVGSDTERPLQGNNDLIGLSLTAARLWVDAEIEGWNLRFGLRGEEHTGLGYFGLAGTADELRLFEIVATREFNENIRVQAGRIRTPFVQTALWDDNQLLFFERSFLGEDWDAFTEGAALNVRVGPLEGWLSVQDGVDREGSSVAITGRGMLHLGAPRGAMHINEGPYDSTDELAVTLAAAAFFDTETDDVSAQSIEAYASVRPFWFSGEVVDNGPGLGDLYSWGVTGSMMITDEFSIQARVENFDRDDGTDVYRVGFTHYLEGHDVKWHMEYADADSNAPLANLGTLTIGAQFSF
jgi:hypothetical protein